MCRGKKGLTNACIRHAKAQLDLDLSSVKNWLRFLEVHYQRPAGSSDPNAIESDEVSKTKSKKAVLPSSFHHHMAILPKYLPSHILSSDPCITQHNSLYTAVESPLIMYLLEVLTQ